MTDHTHFITQALGLAAQALFLSNPNPRVGCVITAPDGQVLGQGFTQQAGGPHAEVMALRDAKAAGRDVRGATAYVTLEPCAHQGRTGPCCDALVQAGIARVVASITDPNPLVAGHGFERLRAAGVEVVVGPGADESRALNIGFFSRMVRGTPWVRLKVAASLDGTTALANGASKSFAVTVSLAKPYTGASPIVNTATVDAPVRRPPSCACVSMPSASPDTMVRPAACNARANWRALSAPWAVGLRLPTMAKQRPAGKGLAAHIAEGPMPYSAKGGSSVSSSACG